jgi:hypothetical protein
MWTIILFPSPNPRTELFKKSPLYSLPLEWNNLDENKYIRNRTTFKTAIKYVLLNSLIDETAVLHPNLIGNIASLDRNQIVCRSAPVSVLSYHITFPIWEPPPGLFVAAPSPPPPPSCRPPLAVALVYTAGYNCQLIS